MPWVVHKRYNTLYPRVLVFATKKKAEKAATLLGGGCEIYKGGWRDGERGLIVKCDACGASWVTVVDDPRAFNCPYCHGWGPEVGN